VHVRVTSGPAAPSASPVIEARGVTVDLGGHRVLDGVDLIVPAGDFVGLVGPNGSGKTTLLRSILGLVPLTRGEVRLLGSDPRLPRVTRRLAYVPQHVVHLDTRFPATAYEVALLGRVAHRGLFRRFRPADHAAVHDAMREVGVEHLADEPIGTLSGGQRQRVFLAKALAAEPELIILDEPTTGVDPRARESFYQLLDHLNHDHQMTVVIVSHDTHALSVAAHRLVAINRRVVYDGPPTPLAEAAGGEDPYGIHVPHGLRPHPEVHR
jgi:zinc transport system ATP-binding protein